MQTEVGSGKNYCWTVHGDPNPETYPCPAGPMFVPMAPPIHYYWPVISK
jgi:hypothetical protein